MKVNFFVVGALILLFACISLAQVQPNSGQMSVKLVCTAWDVDNNLPIRDLATRIDFGDLYATGSTDPSGFFSHDFPTGAQPKNYDPLYTSFIGQGGYCNYFDPLNGEIYLHALSTGHVHHYRHQ